MEHTRALSSQLACLLIAAAAVVSSIGCDSPEQPVQTEQTETPTPAATSAEEQPEPLMASRWKLVSIAGAGVDLTPSADIEIDMVFTLDGRVAGSSGCNRYFSAVELGDAGEMSLGPIGSTMMACPEAIMAQEQKFLRALEGADRYRLSGERLELLSGNEGVLTFEATELPEE